jgi:hypothetical protein
VRREKGERCKTQLIGWNGVTLKGERERDRHSPRRGKSQVDIQNSCGVVHSSPGEHQGRDLVHPRTITWFKYITYMYVIYYNYRVIHISHLIVVVLF